VEAGVSVVLAVVDEKVVAVEVAVVVVVAEAVPLMVVVVHGEHPVQQSHVHLNDQLSELCAQKGLHSPRLVVLLMVVVTGGVVVVAIGVVVVGAAVVGEVPGMHCE